MTPYLDSSALVKLCVTERESRGVAGYVAALASKAGLKIARI